MSKLRNKQIKAAKQNSQLEVAPKNAPVETLGAFVFDPARTPTEGEDVLVRAGKGFRIEAYRGQSCLGVIGETQVLDDEGTEDDGTGDQSDMRVIELSDEDAMVVADDIFSGTCKWTEEGDVIARAVLKILDLLIEEDDDTIRRNNAYTLQRAIYAGTKHQTEAVDRFLRDA
jgi:hypothetical protein